MKEDSIVEQRIQAAAAAGAFDNLPGAGAPLPPDDVGMVPDELRAAYRLLKNAGFAPPQVEQRKMIAALEQTIAADGEPGAAARATAAKKLALLRAQCEQDGKPSLAITAADAYEARLLKRLR